MYDKIEAAMEKAFPMLPMSVIRHVSKILYRELVKVGIQNWKERE